MYVCLIVYFPSSSAAVFVTETLNFLYRFLTYVFCANVHVHTDEGNVEYSKLDNYSCVTIISFALVILNSLTTNDASANGAILVAAPNKQTVSLVHCYDRRATFFSHAHGVLLR